MTALRVAGLAAVCLVATPAFALEQGEHRFNGFGTVGFTHLGGEDDGRSYGIQGQTNDSWRGDQLSKFGAQLSYGITDTLGVTVQGTAKAQQDEWKANLEWAYLSLQANDQLMLRAGRLRSPVYMYSESLDVGYSYPWLRLPDEVYSQVQVTNYEGIDAVYTVPLSYGSVTFQIAGGQAKNRDYYAYDEQFDIDYGKLFGASVSLATNDFGTLRIGYVEADIKTDITGTVDATDIGLGVNQPLPLLNLNKEKGKFTSIGYQYDNGTWISSNEWTSRLIENDGTEAIDSFYLMGGRRFGDFLPHVTYAQLDDNGGRQSSWTLGLNYQATPTVVVKGEYKRVDTKNGFDGVFTRSAQEVFDNEVNGRFGGAVGTPARNYDGDIVSVGVDFVF
ncbi:MAG: porin [Pseudomonas stutzeri]|nr:porin [Stutzerimonas stutzeri]NIM54554.1 porin [Stutzerimonas stutzeri]NIM88206.1 porin [Stutzerimonas stutzeri]NIN79891.1 porin [Stutzerimonas stutzeri]NIP02141.1 porin [Stutzerimonas stutzeri]